MLDLISQLDINGLELVASDDYWCTLIDGLLEPDRRVPAAANPGSDGGFIGDPLYGMRSVSVGVALKRRGRSIWPALSALTATCLLDRDPDGTKRTKTVHFTTTDGRSFTVQVVSTKLSPPVLGQGGPEFLISLVAEDPLLYASTEKSTGNIVRSTGGGLIIPFVSPAVSAGSSGGSGAATNSGNSKTPTRLEFVGPLTNPYVLNQLSGLFMQLNYAIPAGQTIWADSNDNTILINGGGSEIDKKADGASFFGLEPGTNPIVFSTGNSADTGHINVHWRDGSITL